MLTNRRLIQVQWGDCDPAGIVFNPRYFEWFDACTAALIAAAGFDLVTLFERDSVGFPTVDTRSRFTAPSRFGDVVAVESRVTRFGRSSFDVSHKLFKGEALAVESWETRVWAKIDPVNPANMRSQPIPEKLIQALSEDRILGDVNER